LNSSENQESGSVPSKFKQQLPDKDEVCTFVIYCHNENITQLALMQLQFDQLVPDAAAI